MNHRNKFASAASIILLAGLGAGTVANAAEAPVNIVPVFRILNSSYV